ncbi:MAG: hypothetical protein ACFB4J_10115 [Elainellaceae cyanobacterium]
MDQVLGILIIALIGSIVIGAIASGAQRLLGFGIVAAIATILIGTVTGSSFSLPSVVGAIQPNSGLPEQIETINPAAGSTTAAPSSAFSPEQGSGTGSAGNTSAGDTGAGNSASSAGTGTAAQPAGGSTTATGASGTAPANTSSGASRPVNALW